MPFEGGAWRPLTLDECDDVAQALKQLVNAELAKPSPTATVRQDARIVDLLSDSLGYRWHDVRTIQDRLFLELALDGERLEYFQVFQYAADLTRQTGLRPLSEATEPWVSAIPLILQQTALMPIPTAIDFARISQAAQQAQADAAKRLRDRGFRLALKVPGSRSKMAIMKE